MHSLDYPEIQKALAAQDYAAVLALSQARLQNASSAELYYWAGYAAYHLGQYALAHQYFEAALQIRGDLKEVYFQLCLTCLKQGLVGQGVQILLLYASQFQATQDEAQKQLLNFINHQVLSQFKQQTQLSIQFLEAILQTRLIYAWHIFFNLGLLYSRLSEMGEVIQYFQMAHRLSGNPWIILVSATLFPQVYQSHDEMMHWRQRLQANIQNLSERFENPQMVQALLRAPITIFPEHFHLAYQCLNDLEIHQQLMGLYSQIWQVQPQILPPRIGSKIRIGFISAFLRHHSVTHSYFSVVKAACQQPDFEVYALSGTQEIRDHWTEKYQTLCHQFIELKGPLPIRAKMIEDLTLDILVFLDLGMHAKTDHLALFRMAPVQCLLAGHPVTSGSPQMDYFISSDLLEIPGAQAHYSEKLCLIPGALPTTYTDEHAIKLGPLKSRKSLGLPEDKHLYYCPMSLFKIHPDFDSALAGILSQDPQAIILLAQLLDFEVHPQLMARFQQTLGTAAQRIQFLPWLAREDFYQVLLQVDVVLDSFPFSGGNTSCISLLLGQPIVTWPSEFLRGRSTLAYYRLMGLEHLVATSLDDYVAKALKLGLDLEYRAQTQALVKAQNHALLNRYDGIEHLIRQLRTWALDTRKARKS